MEKNLILRSVSRIPATTLHDYIQQGIVSFDELQATGKFIASKQNEVRELVRLAGEVNRVEDEAWAIAQASNTIAAYQNYLTHYPEGRFKREAQVGIQNRQGAENEIKQRAIAELQRDKMSVNELKLRRVLGLDQDNNPDPNIVPILTREDLDDYGIIPPRALDLVLDPPVLDDNVYGWEDLDPLDNDSTDVYVLGVVSSGKSCMLAGLLHYAHSHGFIKLHVKNQVGYRYAQDLIKAVNIGYAPISTPIGGVNYISLDLYEGDDIVHPLNVLEMSGEFLRQTYNPGNENHQLMNSANKFLSNQNRKIIFLVVDYYSASSTESSYRVNQSGQLELILGLMEEDGTLENVDAIHLVLTKSDLLPGGANDLKGMSNFIDENYLSLRKNIRRLKKKYDFRSRTFPFSLGDFYQSDTFKKDKTTSVAIVDQLIADTVFSKTDEKKGGWWPF